MKIYLVGGAVRDKLLGIEAQDLDYVVVGSTAKEMIANGFNQVGADFPVFLHPESGDEYALARTERKSGKGYNGFECETDDVTLIQDLQRRDLTINAMAFDVEHKVIIDPFGGQKDLRDGILRHVSTAFAEDPLRILRVARFAARYNFEVDTTTNFLMGTIAQSGECELISRERVWQEFSKAMCEPEFLLFFKVLYDSSAMFKFFPGMNDGIDTEWYFDGSWDILDMPSKMVILNVPAKTLRHIKAPNQVIKFVEAFENQECFGDDPDQLVESFVKLGLLNNTNHNKWYRQVSCEQYIKWLDAAESVTFDDLDNDIRKSKDGELIGAELHQLRVQRVSDVQT